MGRRTGETYTQQVDEMVTAERMTATLEFQEKKIA